MIRVWTNAYVNDYLRFRKFVKSILYRIKPKKQTCVCFLFFQASTSGSRNLQPEHLSSCHRETQVCPSHLFKATLHKMCLFIASLDSDNRGDNWGRAFVYMVAESNSVARIKRTL